MDQDGGIAYQSLSTNQLLSVPYALLQKPLKPATTGEIRLLFLLHRSESLSKNSGLHYAAGGTDIDTVTHWHCNLTAVYFPVAYGTVE